MTGAGKTGTTEASVIIPARDMAPQLQNTLAALSRQSVKHEIIVVDDSSSEKSSVATMAAAAKHGAQCLRLRRVGRKGRMAGQARNLGAGHARGRVLLFLDADMAANQGLVAEHLASQSKADVVLGVRDQDERQDYFQINSDIEKLPAKWAMLHSHNFSVKKKVFMAAGGFSEIFSCWGGEDQELGYRLRKHRFCLNTKAFASHQEHETEYRSAFEKKAMGIKGALRFYRRHRAREISDFFGLSRKRVRAMVSSRCNNYCAICRELGRKGDDSPDLSGIELIPKDWKVLIAGGEPTLHPKFFSLLAECRGRPLEVMTNARSFSYMGHARKSVQYARDYCVSFFGTSPESHDAVTRVPGSFAQAVKGIANLRSLCAGVAVNVIAGDMDTLIRSACYWKERGMPVRLTIGFIPDNGQMRIIRGLGAAYTERFIQCQEDYENGRFSLDAARFRDCKGCRLLSACRGQGTMFGK